MLTKICTKCGEVKDIKHFWKKGGIKKGFRSACKKCLYTQNKIWWGTSPKAKVLKRIKRKRGPSYKVWIKNNKDKVNGYSKKWKANNKRKVSYQHREYVKNNPEIIRAIAKRFRKNNPDKVRNTNRIYRGLRRAMEKNTDITVEFLSELKRGLNGECPYCFCKIKDWHLDHKIPLSRGGLHTKKNVMFCCGKCNLRKRDKTVEEFLEYIKLA